MGVPPPSPRGFYRNRHCLHLEQAFETLLEEMKLHTDVFIFKSLMIETFASQLELVFLRAYSCLCEYDHVVLCYSCNLSL